MNKMKKKRNINESRTAFSSTAAAQTANIDAIMDLSHLQMQIEQSQSLEYIAGERH